MYLTFVLILVLCTTLADLALARGVKTSARDLEKNAERPQIYKLAEYDNVESDETVNLPFKGKTYSSHHHKQQQPEVHIVQYPQSGSYMRPNKHHSGEYQQQQPQVQIIEYPQSGSYMRPNKHHSGEQNVEVVYVPVNKPTKKHKKPYIQPYYVNESSESESYEEYHKNKRPMKKKKRPARPYYASQEEMYNKKKVRICKRRKEQAPGYERPANYQENNQGSYEYSYESASNEYSKN